MPGFIDLSYYVNNISLNNAIERYKTSFGYLAYLRKQMNVEVIQHSMQDERIEKDGVVYSSFKSAKGFFHLPLKTHRYIKAKRPDVVLVQGLQNPVQVTFLRRALGNKVKIIAQHHGEYPANGIKGLFQKFADRYIDAYFFTSLGNVQSWVNRSIIASEKKCYEVLEASTYFSKQNKQYSKDRVGMYGNNDFLWVGRLNANKDPLTALQGFNKYVRQNNGAKLYMIYHEMDMFKEVEAFIVENELQKFVHLVGKTEHDELQYWFSAADYYLSASHKEAAGYALIEAMACGCIPVVTDIPPFKKITDNGRVGILYQRGDFEDLYKKLSSLDALDKEELSNKVKEHFDKQLSFEKIANDVCKAIQCLEK